MQNALQKYQPIFIWSVKLFRKRREEKKTRIFHHTIKNPIEFIICYLCAYSQVVLAIRRKKSFKYQCNDFENANDTVINTVLKDVWKNLISTTFHLFVWDLCADYLLYVLLLLDYVPTSLFDHLCVFFLFLHHKEINDLSALIPYGVRIMYSAMSLKFIVKNFDESVSIKLMLVAASHGIYSGSECVLRGSGDVNKRR